MSEISKKNLSWVNYARFMCMILIYFQHTMNRIGFSTLPSGVAVSIWFKPFYVNLFFFISGYLLFKKYREIQFDKLDNKSWNNTYGRPFLDNIIFKIAIPTIIFSAIMLFKLAIRGDYGIFFNSLLIDSILANSMWFTAALTISELILYLIFRIYRSKSFLVYALIGVALAVIATQLTLSDFTIANNSHIPWRYKSGMAATLFLISGGILEKYEQVLSKWNPTAKFLIVVSCLSFYIIGINSFSSHIYTNVGSGKITILGFFIVILACLCIIQICKFCKPNRFVDYFGRHTLVLYFLCGALPETIGIIMMKVRPVLDWGQVISITIMSMGLAFALTYLINKYLPWLLDIRVLRKK